MEWHSEVVRQGDYALMSARDRSILCRISVLARTMSKKYSRVEGIHQDFGHWSLSDRSKARKRELGDGKI